MPQQIINLGATGSGAGGDSARTAFEKAIANFAELYIAALPDTPARKQAARDMFGLGTASTRAVQTGPTDATPNALLAVGAFGLGAKNVSVTPSVGSSGLLSGIRENGLYRITSTNPDSPLGSSIGQLLHAGQAADYAVQVAFKGGAGGTGKEAFWRNIDAGTASAWQMFYLQSNILGPVSQAAGVPTGALFQNVTNANGTALIFPDGTAICRKLATASFAGNSAFLDTGLLDWPVNFASTNELSVSESLGVIPSGVAGSSIAYCRVDKSASTVRAYVYANSNAAGFSSGNTMEVRFTAMGKVAI